MAEPARQIAPDEAAFLEDLAGARFQAGVDKRRWRLVGEVEWPHAVIAVSAAPRTNGATEYAIRFELSDYPAVAATGTPWHPEERRPLSPAERPKGGRVEHAFRTDWESGNALYIPCDRVAIAGHPDWPARYRGELWDPAVGITSYLVVVHDLLNEEEHAGA